MRHFSNLALLSLIAASIGCGGAGGTGTLPGPHYSAPVIINVPAPYIGQINAVSATGKMVGLGMLDLNTPVPFYWSSPTATPTILPGNIDVDQSIPTSINDSGTIVGWHGSNNLISQPLIWSTPTTEPTLLSRPAGLTTGAAYSVNNAGQIVGMCAEPNNSNTVLGVIWSPSLAVSSIANGSGHPLSGASFITDAGAIYGYQSDAFFSQLYFPAAWSTAGANSVLLKNLGGSAACGGVTSVNQRTGYAVTSGLYDPMSSNTTLSLLWKSPSSKPVTIVGGTASCIGDDGVLVGTDMSGQRAMVWQSYDRLPADMNTLIPKNTGWTLHSAQFQLADGSVIGYGTQVVGGVSTDGLFYAKRLP